MNDMFCFQCEQTAMGKGCTRMGVCGKTFDVANEQDGLSGSLVALARAVKEERSDAPKRRIGAERFVYHDNQRQL